MPKAEFEVIWNVPALIQAFGGVQALRKTCLDSGLTAPGEMTARMWGQRQAIPANWIATLLWVGFQTGIIRDVQDFILKPDDMF